MPFPLKILLDLLVGLAIGIGVLMGVDTIPDMFRTTANVTGWLAAGSILGRTPNATATATILLERT